MAAIYERGIKKSTKQKEKQQIIEINKQNALELILNGYSGNTVKKALNQAIEEQGNKVEMETSSLLLTNSTNNETI